MPLHRTKEIAIPAPPQKVLGQPDSVSLAQFRSVFLGPEVRQLFEYWDAKRQSQRYPCRGDIDVIEMPRNLLPFLYLITVEPDGGYRFRLAGTRLTEAFRKDVSGRRIEEIMDGYDLQKAKYSYSNVQQSGQAWYSCATYRVDEDVGDINYQRLTLPLGQDGVVDQLLGAIVISKEDRIYESFYEVYRRRGMKQIDRCDYVLSLDDEAM